MIEYYNAVKYVATHNIYKIIDIEDGGVTLEDNKGHTLPRTIGVVQFLLQLVYKQCKLIHLE